MDEVVSLNKRVEDGLEQRREEGAMTMRRVRSGGFLGELAGGLSLTGLSSRQAHSRAEGDQEADRPPINLFGHEEGECR